MIIETNFFKQWLDLKRRNCIPPQAKDSQDEPRNAMLMCPNHRISFEKGIFIIRYVPKASPIHN